MAMEIDKLRQMVIANAVQVEHGTPDSADVGLISILMPPDSDITARKLLNQIERAEQGVGGAMTVDDLIDGPAYTALAVWLGDHGVALAFMGLGNLLEMWDIVKPEDEGVTDENLRQQMMGMGFIRISVGPESILFS